MSSLVMTMAIVGGIALLILIAYVNQLAENNKRKKARLKADLAERYRRVADLNEQLAGQLMTPQLKQLLSKQQLHFAQQLLDVDKRDAAYTVAAKELRKLIGLGEDIPIRNAPIAVTSDAQAKAVRAQLEALHGQITRGAQAGLLSAEESRYWVQEIRHMLATVYIELFGYQARQAMQDKQLGHARLALERGVQFLQKQGDIERYQAQLGQFQKLLARINGLLLNAEQQDDDESSELTEGLKSMEGDEWKKKALYD